MQSKESKEKIRGIVDRTARVIIIGIDGDLSDTVLYSTIRTHLWNMIAESSEVLFEDLRDAMGLKK